MATVEHRCKGTTAKGKPCMSKLKAEDDYCRHHDPNPRPPKPTPPPKQPYDILERMQFFLRRRLERTPPECEDSKELIEAKLQQLDDTAILSFDEDWELEVIDRQERALSRKEREDKTDADEYSIDFQIYDLEFQSALLYFFLLCQKQQKPKPKAKSKPKPKAKVESEVEESDEEVSSGDEDSDAEEGVSSGDEDSDAEEE